VSISHHSLNIAHIQLAQFLNLSDKPILEISQTFLTMSFRRFNLHFKIGNSFLGVGTTFCKSSLQIFATTFQFIALKQEALFAHQQQIVIFDAMIHNVLQRTFILFKLRNTLAEWCPAILSNDSFDSSCQF
jgi:hypothetical protein